jgi:hypothetical protein
VIGKGKPHKPYEFGVKVSVATTVKHSKGGQFVTHVQALPGNPYDGHTLARIIPAIEELLGNNIERAHVDARTTIQPGVARFRSWGYSVATSKPTNTASATDPAPLNTDNRVSSAHRSHVGGEVCPRPEQAAKHPKTGAHNATPLAYNGELCT